MSDVPEGYKMSEVGVIPEGWEVKPLGEILQSARLGGNYQNSEKENNHPLVKMGNIDRGFIDISKVEYITDKSIPSEKDKLQYGDVLFNTRNTLELVGKVAIWRNELPLAHYNSNLLRLEFNPSDVSSNFFINNILNTKQILSQLKRFATGTTSVAAIYTRDLIKLQIPLPPLPEQQAIASALSDVDALITALEQLITKKRNIKQGAMQQLLTGEKRLPGFGGEWEVKKLMEIAEVRGRVGWKGYTKADLKPSGPLAIGAKHIDDSNRLCLNEPTHLSYEKYLESPEIMVTFNDILIVQRGTIGKLVHIDRQIGEATINPSMVILRPKKAISSHVYYQLVSKMGQTQILSDTSSTGVPMITQKQIGEFIVPCPSLPEQQAIAQILRDMDAEIEALEQKQAKYKAIKQGMMQELLTGKTRLV